MPGEAEMCWILPRFAGIVQEVASPRSSKRPGLDRAELGAGDEGAAVARVRPGTALPPAVRSRSISGLAIAVDLPDLQGASAAAQTARRRPSGENAQRLGSATAEQIRFDPERGAGLDLDEPHAILMADSQQPLRGESQVLDRALRHFLVDLPAGLMTSRTTTRPFVASHAQQAAVRRNRDRRRIGLRACGMTTPPAPEASKQPDSPIPTESGHDSLCRQFLRWPPCDRRCSRSTVPGSGTDFSRSHRKAWPLLSTVTQWAPSGSMATWTIRDPSSCGCRPTERRAKSLVKSWMRISPRPPPLTSHRPLPLSAIVVTPTEWPVRTRRSAF